MDAHIDCTELEARSRDGVLLELRTERLLRNVAAVLWGSARRRSMQMTLSDTRVAVCVPPSDRSPSHARPRNELPFAPWAQEYERLLNQHCVADFAPTNRTPRGGQVVTWVPCSETLEVALTCMRERGATAIPLVEDNAAIAGLLDVCDVAAYICAQIGYLDDDDDVLLRPCRLALGAARTMRADATAMPTWLLSADAPAVDVMRAFALHDCWQVCVRMPREALPSAFLCQVDLMAHLVTRAPSPSALNKLRALDAGMFAPNVLCVNGDTRARTVFACMVKHKVSALAIIQGDCLASQVSVTDILALADGSRALLDAPILTYLARGGLHVPAPVTCPADMDVLGLMSLFERTRARRVYVVSSLTQRVVGVATLSGVFRAIAGVPNRCAAASDAAQKRQ